MATASNTWGLVILTLLLGYGLVEVHVHVNTKPQSYVYIMCLFAGPGSTLTVECVSTYVHSQSLLFQSS